MYYFKDMLLTNKFAFFWKGRLSQWHNSPMVINGITFNCAEQYMMYMKAIIFGDTETAQLILDETDPAKQQALGRLIKGFDKAVWDKECVAIVFKGNMAKFNQNDSLRKELLELGSRVLVEASPTDCIWGVGLSETDGRIEDPANWRGLNLLGWTLTLVKNQL